MNNNNEPGSRIVTQARTWIGTKFVHQGRVKKTSTHDGGVDCLGLLTCVADELGFTINNKTVKQIDEVNYARLPDTRRLQNKLSENLREVTINDLSQGDVLLLKINGNPQHLAIVSNYGEGEFGIIHSYMNARRVVEHRLDDLWAGRIVKAYRFG